MSGDPETAVGLMVARLSVITRKITFSYTNWRGETATRSAEPTDIWFGSTEWHPEPQWFITACDTDKNVMRDFAMKDMRDVRYTDAS